MSSISSDNIPFKKPKIFKNTSKNTTNQNLELIITVQNLTKENLELKEALTDLESDLKEKDQSIEESKKIITKLKEEYAKVIQEFESMEKSYNELHEELDKKTLEISEIKKAQSVMNVVLNKDKDEISFADKKLLYKQNVILKKKILSSGDVKQNNEKSNIKNKNEIIEKSKKKNLNYIKIINEKDLIIEKQNTKIKELNDIINELNEKNKNFINIVDDIFGNKNASFSYKDLTKENLLLPNNIKVEMPEEFIFNMNLNKELIKSELYSSLIREYHFNNFLQKIFEKMNLSKLVDAYKYTIEHKNKYLQIIQENNLLKEANKVLYKTLIELKNDININNAKVKNKCIKLIENIDAKSEIFNKIKKLNKIKIKNSNNSYVLKNGKNIKINFNNIDSINKIGNILNTQRVLKTPTLKENNLKEFKNERYNMTLNNSKENENKNNKIINITRINSSNRKKKRIIKCNNYEADIIIKNNTLELNPLKTDCNKLHDKFNSTITSYENKTLINNTSNNYIKDIFQLQKEFNSIISKSVVQDNIGDSFEAIPKNNVKYMKITNIGVDNKNDMQKNLDEINQRRNENIKYLKTDNNRGLFINNTFFTSDFFVNILFKINVGIFIKEELDKYQQIYNLTSYENIFLTFKKTCNELKNMTDEINLKINKSHYLPENNMLNKTKNNNDEKDFLDGSFKVFNDRILKLKKLEFEFINMNEYIKSYLIAQEAIIKLMYKTKKRNIKFEPIDKLFNLFEDCLSYRINEMNENIKFNRKLLIKLFKNQINCLFLSLEYKFK